MAAELFYLDKSRFDLIYMMSLYLPSWKVIGMNVLGNKVTPEEYEFVLKHTGRKFMEVKE